MNPVAAIVLAAGGASRMGRAKQTLLFEGEPLVARAARAALEAGCDRVIVVVGAYGLAVKSAATMQGVTFVENPRWAEGLASSLRAGLAAAESAEAVLLLLADEPHVDAAVLRRLREAFDHGGRVAAACAYSGVVGPPAIFRSSLFGDLAALKGDEGARRMLARDPQQVALVDFPLGALDVDTPVDAARLLGGVFDQADVAGVAVDARVDEPGAVRRDREPRPALVGQRREMDGLRGSEGEKDDRRLLVLGA